MSVDPTQQTAEATQSRVLEVGELPVTEVHRFARRTGEVHFERRGGRTYLVADR